MATLPPVEFDGRTIAGPADVRAHLERSLKYLNVEDGRPDWAQRFSAAWPDRTPWIEQATFELFAGALCGIEERESKGAGDRLEDLALCLGHFCTRPPPALVREFERPRRQWSDETWLLLLRTAAKLVRRREDLPPEARLGVARAGDSAEAFDNALWTLSRASTDDAAAHAIAHAARLAGRAAKQKGPKILSSLGHLLVGDLCSHRARIIATFASAPAKARAALRAAVENAIRFNESKQSIGATVLAEIDALPDED